MRTVILTLLAVALSATGAGANGPPLPQPRATLTVTNQCDGAVEVRIGDDPPLVLGPLGKTSRSFGLPHSGGSVKATVSARLVGTSLRATRTFTLNVNTTTNAAVRTNAAKTKLTLEPISGQLAISRESAMVLASTGGLLPLFMLGCLLGREPRRRRESGDAPTSADEVSLSDPT